MGLKRTLIALLALSVAFQGAQPWSVATREVSAESKAAAPKRKAQPRRVFSTRASVDPLTPEAVAFSGALAKSIPSRLTRESLRKFTFKRAKSNSFVSAETKFSLSALASDRRSWARGVATVTAGDMFVAFIPSVNGLVGIVEAVPRRVGKKKVDLKREAQLRAAGFKVHLLVDRFQVVLWDSLDPKGIELTVAKAPTLITRPLSPQEFASVLIPPKGSASSMKVAGMVAPALLAVITASTVYSEEKKPALLRFLRAETEYWCAWSPPFGLPADKTACPEPNQHIKCNYITEKKSLGGAIGSFESKKACEENAHQLARENCGKDTKLLPSSLNCPLAVPTGVPRTETFPCPIEVLSVSSPEVSCTLLGRKLTCPHREATSVSAKETDGQLVCTCLFEEKLGDSCVGNPGLACHYRYGELSEVVPRKRNHKPEEVCESHCGEFLQPPVNAEIECPAPEV